MSRCSGTLPVTSSWAGSIDAPELDKYNQIIFVALADNTETDGSLQFPYHTIAEGLAEAISRTPSSTNKICVYIFGGRYNESGLTTTAHVHIQGANVDTSVIYNTNNILTINNDNSNISDVTFEATGSNSIITIDGTSMTDYAKLRNCHFLGNGNDSTYINIINGGLVKFYDCISEAQNVGDQIIQTDTDADNDFKIYKSNILGDILHQGGELELTDVTANSGISCTGSSDLSITDTFLRNSVDHCLQLGTTGDITLYQSTFISPGYVDTTNYHCVNATVDPGVNEWIGNTMRHDGVSPNYSVYASVAFTFSGDRNDLEEGYNVNVTNDGLAQKAIPVTGDLVVIEDSADSYKRKKAQLGNLPPPTSVPAHASTHESGGSDEIDVGGLFGVLADDQSPTAHAIDGSKHTGSLAHSSLSGITADDHHTHANKAELDLITDGDHDVRLDNPHSVTKTQVGLSNVTNDSQLKRADNDWSGFTNNPSPWENDLVLLERGTDGAKRTTTIGSLIGAGLEDYESSSNGLTTTTSNSDQDKVTLTETLEGGDYLFQYSAEISSSVINTHCLAKAFIDSSTIGRQIYHRDAFYQPGSFNGFVVQSLSSGSHTFKITFARIEAGGTARIRRARIKVRRLRG